MRRALSFVGSAVEFDEYRVHLKSVTCPHCRAVGHLNRHGYLRGYAERGNEREVRGWRVFCSNRGRRRGCGRTYSILLAGVLRRRSVSAARFWAFLNGVLKGASVQKSWEAVRSGFSVECGYRLWSAFRRFETTLRTLLCRIEEPPCKRSRYSWSQTLEHLRKIFGAKPCPIAAWQLRFQRAFAS